jgi:integrase
MDGDARLVATLLLSRNVHPKYVQELLGHASIALTLDTPTATSYPGWGPDRNRYRGRPLLASLQQLVGVYRVRHERRTPGLGQQSGRV